MKFQISLITTLTALFFCLTSALARDIRTVEVMFDTGASSSSISDRIQGYQSVQYTLRARAKQYMRVKLQPESPHIAYFNIFTPSTLPGHDEAMYIGSIHGQQFEGELPEDGVYLIQVYQMRSAARRNSVAEYTLEITITDSKPSPTDVQTQPD